MLTAAHFIFGTAALTVATMAAVQDIRERLIANRLVVLLLAAAVPHHLLTATSVAHWLAIVGSALGLATVMFLVGFLLWQAGGLGGGDVKLLVASGFFVGIEGIAVLLIATALAGGALAIAYLLVSRLATMVIVPFVGPACAGSGAPRPSIPYGVAIAAGFACAVVPSLPLLVS